MKKVVIQGSILIVLIVTIGFILNQVDWMKIIQPERISSKTDQKLGEILKSSFDLQYHEIENESIKKPIEKLLSSLGKCNQLSTDNVKILIYDDPEINAFALPGNQIVLCSGLIQNCTSEAGLQGVIAPELSHIELKHIQKKMIQQYGLSAVLSVTVGGKSAEIINEMTHLLSSSAYDRMLEKEADLQAVTYLNNCQVDAYPFADLLLRITAESEQFPSSLSWISTHPEAQERADYINLHQKNKKIVSKTYLSDEEWTLIQEKLAAR